MDKVNQNFKKRRIELFVKSQKGDMENFIKIKQKNKLENFGECFLNV